MLHRFIGINHTYININIYIYILTYINLWCPSLTYICRVNCRNVYLVVLVNAAKRHNKDPSNLLSLFRMFPSQDCRLVLSCVICIFFLTWSSKAQSVCEREFCLLVNRCLRRPASDHGLNSGRQLASFRFKITSLCQRNYNWTRGTLNAVKNQISMHQYKKIVCRRTTKGWSSSKQLQWSTVSNFARLTSKMTKGMPHMELSAYMRILLQLIMTKKYLIVGESFVNKRVV